MDVKKFKSSIELLLQEMKEFQNCIQEEYKAVLEHNIFLLEAATQKKQNIAQTIAEHLESFKNFGSSLSDVFKKITDPQNLQIIRKLEEKTLNAVEEFKLEIAKNRFTLDRLLKNHQESFRFWCEIATEEASSYDKKGVKTFQATLAPQFEAKV